MVQGLLDLRYRLFCKAFYIKVVYRYCELDVVKVGKNSYLVCAFQGVVSQDFLYTSVVSPEISMGLAFFWKGHKKLSSVAC